MNRTISWRWKRNAAVTAHVSRNGGGRGMRGSMVPIEQSMLPKLGLLGRNSNSSIRTFSKELAIWLHWLSGASGSPDYRRVSNCDRYDSSRYIIPSHKKLLLLSHWYVKCVDPNCRKVTFSVNIRLPQRLRATESYLLLLSDCKSTTSMLPSTPHS
jgi:hypothetical protein